MSWIVFRDDFKYDRNKEKTPKHTHGTSNRTREKEGELFNKGKDEFCLSQPKSNANCPDNTGFHYGKFGDTEMKRREYHQITAYGAQIFPVLKTNRPKIDPRSQKNVDSRKNQIRNKQKRQELFEKTNSIETELNTETGFSQPRNQTSDNRLLKSRANERFSTHLQIGRDAKSIQEGQTVNSFISKTYVRKTWNKETKSRKPAIEDN